MPTHTIVTTDPLTPPRSLPCPRYLAGPALRLEICRRSTGQFTGERTMRTGRRALTRIRAIEPGEVIELDREQLFGLIQTDAELSDIFMRASSAASS
jgi:CRP-like cAMP-binding protein